MIPSGFRGAARRISGLGPYQEAADEIGCELAAIQAVAEVESRNAAFLPSGRPPILFERHVFARETGDQFTAGHPRISGPPGGYGAPGDAQYLRLEEAYNLAPIAALRSASWGRFQIMGFNAQVCGWPSVEAFVAAMCESEAQQLAAFVGFVRANPAALRALQRRDWAAFAHAYNGPNYRVNRYDEKMADAWARFAGSISAPEIDNGIVGKIDTPREGQITLNELGFDCGPADGKVGPLTLAALQAFAQAVGDPRIKTRMQARTYVALAAALQAQRGFPAAVDA
ncbi:N-acetylmuramidase family protein [Albimonas pacifica]|uniref:N-acetylmuramidase domain-containing protein n=1 Tax=Albimonas pacifica TaxID=1114924 RepID=A0A1I3P6C4_9RHOB|nr:N-acetylmuramidase family protein [Albimonas pacifica]SFJ17073.1 Protein of unknown function [Albimonas pacifica]